MCLFLKQKSRLVFLKNLQSTHTLIRSSIVGVFWQSLNSQSLIKGISSELRDLLVYTTKPNSYMHYRQHGYLLVQLKKYITWYPGKIIKITASLSLRVVSSIVLGQLNVISFLHFESAAGAGSTQLFSHNLWKLSLNWCVKVERDSRFDIAQWVCNFQEW